MNLKRWYVVHSHPREEERALRNLEQQGFVVWLPRVRQVRRHARRVEQVVASLFPGYLFANLDVNTEQWRAINSTFGVIRLLCHQDTPLPAPIGLVEQLMTRSSDDGVIQIQPRRYAQGDSLRVVDGPFADAEAFFHTMSGRDRAVILLNLLGRPVRTTVSIRSLEA